jgi:hypothetical protein
MRSKRFVRNCAVGLALIAGWVAAPKRSTAAAPPASTTAVPADNGRGLHAEFFSDVELKTRVAERIDPDVSYVYSDGSPATGVEPDFWSARWTGFLKAPRKGAYKLVLKHDDGARLWIDDKLAIDDWRQSARGEARIELTGEPQPIRVELFESRGGCAISLRWIDTKSGEELTIPPECFFHDREVAAKAKVNKPLEPEKGHGLDVAFYDQAFRRKLGERKDFHLGWWGDGIGIAAGLPKDHFAARWTGFIKAPKPGNYKLISRADDQLLVWIDGSPVIDKVRDVVVALSDKPHTIRIDYIQTVGGSFYTLNWAAMDGSFKEQPIPPEAFFTDKKVAEAQK